MDRGIAPANGPAHRLPLWYSRARNSGHLTEGCLVRTTAEVILAADDRLRFTREHDPATGYSELVVRPPDP